MSVDKVVVGGKLWMFVSGLWFLLGLPAGGEIAMLFSTHTLNSVTASIKKEREAMANERTTYTDEIRRLREALDDIVPLEGCADSGGCPFDSPPDELVKPCRQGQKLDPNETCYIGPWPTFDSNIRVPTNQINPMRDPHPKKILPKPTKPVPESTTE